MLPGTLGDQINRHQETKNQTEKHTICVLFFQLGWAFFFFLPPVKTAFYFLTIAACEKALCVCVHETQEKPDESGLCLLNSSVYMAPTSLSVINITTDQIKFIQVSC